jgi:uncharacterized RDD family membrane protein YckC
MSKKLPQPHEKASLFGRFLANVVDALLVSMVTAFLALYFWGTSDQGQIGESAALLVLVLALYEIVCVAIVGRTIGKRIFRQRVVTDLTITDAPGWRVSIVRYCVKVGLPLYLLLFVLPIQYVQDFINVVVLVTAVTLLFSKSRQGWHDHFAKTWVTLDKRKPK